jgi:hypothetical protein
VLTDDIHAVFRGGYIKEQSLEERIAKLEGRFANSWATHSREEYETAFRSSCNQEIMNYVTKVVIAAVLFLVGSGYFFIRSSIRSATLEVFHDKNEALIRELKSEVDKEINEARADYAWQRFHDYGIQYRYNAELFEKVPVTVIPEAIKRKYYLRAFGKMAEYYNSALARDPKKGQSYYELAQLHYDLAEKFGLTDTEFFRPEAALQEYQLASDYYDNFEKDLGWRADAYKHIASINLEKAEKSTDPRAKNEYTEKSSQYLEKAKHDYERAQDSLDVRDGLNETNTLLSRIESMKSSR